MNNIYEPKFVEDLFDKMSGSYARVNYISSFGFNERWRRQCIAGLNIHCQLPKRKNLTTKDAEKAQKTQRFEKAVIEESTIVVDLMTGMGECWKYLIKEGGKSSTIIGLDFSNEMVCGAQKKKVAYNNPNIHVLNENVFNNSIPNHKADYVVSAFGLKTFNDDQLEMLADEIYRILKPRGEFSLVDVSVPKNRVLRLFYMFYLKKVIPTLGWLLLGSPETYKMLGVYTQAFGNSKKVYEIFSRKGFECGYVEYFYGCASGVKGRK